MKPLAAILILCAAGVAALPAQAQVYQWKDAAGVTHFSDMPPPASAGKVKVQPGASRANAPAGLPYAVADAARRHPVVLYTGNQCDACDQGRALLQARGIPFTEKTVDTSADLAALNQAGGAGKLPLLLIGTVSRSGFEAGAWQAALTKASYPSQRSLPAGYQAPGAAPAAPPPVPAPAVKPAAAPDDDTASPPPPPRNGPPDFQF